MENQAQSAAAPTVKTSELLALLKSGMSRADINKKFGFNTATAKAVWSHPNLRNKRVPPPEQAVTVNLVDDIEIRPKVTRAKKAETEATATAAPEQPAAFAPSPTPAAEAYPAPETSDAQSFVAQAQSPSPAPIPASQPQPAMVDGGWGA